MSAIDFGDDDPEEGYDLEDSADEQVEVLERVVADVEAHGLEARRTHRVLTALSELVQLRTRPLPPMLAVIVDNLIERLQVIAT